MVNLEKYPKVERLVRELYNNLRDCDKLIKIYRKDGKKLIEIFFPII